MGSETATLEVANATVYRGDTRVFDNFNLSLPGGRNCAILGPNGAGKSTLLKLLLRELHPVVENGAYVRVFGRERWNIAELKAQLGVVSTDLQFRYSPNAEGLSVILSGYYASIGTWGHQSFSRTELDTANAIMDRLGITHLQKKAFAMMSTGEQRRFLLGRALINDPSVLILDEPTSGLDVPATFSYLNVIQSLMSEGKTIILVTHHLHEIPPEVDYVVLLKAGSVVMAGEKSIVLTQENLSALFETKLELVNSRDWYQVLPD